MAKGKRANEGESVSGYFRKVFEENPKWLKGRSNAAILERWLADHPNEKEVPDRIKANLANIKSVLRHRKRKRKAAARADGGLAVSGPRKGARSLESLEEQIDDCVTFAKNLDREGLHDVIQLLRRARNIVVWKSGQ